MTLKITDKIFVAGHRGLIGQALVSVLKGKGYEKILIKTHSELDLTDTEKTFSFLASEKPDVIFLAAAKVGGINANNIYRADFIYQNLMIQNNVIWGAHEADVRELVFLGSSCIYPKHASQPISEDSLLQGSLEETNRPYAIAKIAGLELVDSLRRQYSRNYFSVMPTNLFGPGDNFDLQNSHVLPAMIRKIVFAKQNNLPEVEIWGTGAPLREFMYSEDCADAIIFAAENCDSSYFKKLGQSYLNVGTGFEISIGELAHLISRILNYSGKLTFNTAMPDGTPRKLLDSSRIRQLGWKPKLSLQEAIRRTIAWYEENLPSKTAEA